ncbi:MAG: hypothetical protein QF922_01390, partial [SAR324 cluster bacterium]|nr:hypothetical protein [SAR324 cluster bacterium]
MWSTSGGTAAVKVIGKLPGFRSVRGCHRSDSQAGCAPNSDWSFDGRYDRVELAHAMMENSDWQVAAEAIQRWLKKTSGCKGRIESSVRSWNMNGFATRLKFVLPMRFRSFVLACCLAIQLLPVIAQAENRLNSAVLRGIVERFTSLHYAQKPLDNALSQTIFSNYLRRLDPGHYYFLESDIESFKRYQLQVDDLLRRGNPDFALDVFSRFKTRISERLEMLEEILQEEFDFSKDAQWQLDRKEAPYPKTTE